MRKFQFPAFFAIALSALMLCATPAAFAGSKLKGYQGKWVVVTYWAEWCGYCLRELPELNRFYNKHKDKVQVIGVNFDGTPAARLNTFKIKHGISFPLVSHFPLQKYHQQQINSIPTTIFFGPDGRYVTSVTGAQTERDFARITGIYAVAKKADSAKDSSVR